MTRHSLPRWIDQPLLFIFCRLVTLISLPLEGLRGFGDFAHFYNLASMGRPFLDIWVEFPPVFPFLSAGLYRLSGGQEHVYGYLLALVLILSQALTIYLFGRLSERIYAPGEARERTWVFFALLLALPYGWWYFDPIAVLAILLGLFWLIEGKDLLAGLAIALGILTKWFPIFLLPVAWHLLPARRAFRVTSVAVLVPCIVLGSLLLASPEITAASLKSQASKGSWETVWALIDGNYNTGNFGPLAERYQPSAAALPRGNPARLSPIITLLPFALLGAILFLRARFAGPPQAVAFLGLALSVFFLWSPGWSPQWVLYLLPLILLVLPKREGLLAAVVLLLINLLEWPVLLSRGLFSSLWLTVPVRTLLVGLLAILFYSESTSCSDLVLLEDPTR